MNKPKLYIIFIVCFATLTATKGMALSTKMLKQDSIYRVWKFKNAELIQDPSGVNRSVTIDKYDLWDLTKKGTLTYTTTDSPGVHHSVPYKLINNAIALQFPSKNINVEVQFKISELTTDRLRLIMHVTYKYKEQLKEEDIITLVFDAQN